MKGLIHWGLILSLAGGSFVAPAFLGQMSAIALSEAEILKRMDTIPVFIITDQEGNLLPAFIQDPNDKDKKRQFVSFFLNHKDAQAVVSKIKADNPEVGNKARITTISLGQAYRLKKDNSSKADKVVFSFQPMKQQVDFARSILEQDGQPAEKFNSIPLFFLADSSNKSAPLTIENGKEKFTPFYFNRQDVQGVLEQLKQQKPEVANSMRIQVTSLDNLLNVLLQGNAPDFQFVSLVPSRESLQFVNQQQKNTPTQSAKPK